MANSIGGNYQGYGEQVITLCADSTVTAAGVPVAMKDHETVGLCNDGDVFMGIVVSAKDGYAAVQTGGVVTAKKSGNGGYGFKNLVAGPNGTVKTSTSAGREHLLFGTDDDCITFVL